MVTPPIPVVKDCCAVVVGAVVVSWAEVVGKTDVEGRTVLVGAAVEERAMEPVEEAEAAPQSPGPAMSTSLQSYQS